MTLVIGASLSEPHIDETNARNPYIIGASLSEPHINGTAMREFYIIYYILLLLWYVRHAKLYPQHGSMDMNAKYSIAHSHATAISRMYAILI